MPIEFGSEVLIFAACACFIAAFVHGSIGFGFPLVATPLLALVTDIHTAILLTLIPTLLVNTSTIVSEGQAGSALRRFLPLALLAMAGSMIGTWILLFSNPWFFEALLAIAILVYLLFERVNLKMLWIREHPGASRIIFGISAGILGGLTNVMAPVLIIYSLESRHAKSEIIQAANLCFMLGKVAQLALFAVHGRFTLNALSISTAMLVVVSVALYFSVRIRKRIDTDVYTRVLRVFLFILAVSLLVKTAQGPATAMISNPVTETSIHSLPLIG